MSGEGDGADGHPSSFFGLGHLSLSFPFGLNLGRARAERDENKKKGTLPPALGEQARAAANGGLG